MFIFSILFCPHSQLFGVRRPRPLLPHLISPHISFYYTQLLFWFSFFPLSSNINYLYYPYCFFFFPTLIQYSPSICLILEPFQYYPIYILIFYFVHSSHSIRPSYSHFCYTRIRFYLPIYSITLRSYSIAGHTALL